MTETIPKPPWPIAARLRELARQGGGPLRKGELLAMARELIELRRFVEDARKALGLEEAP